MILSVTEILLRPSMNFWDPVQQWNLLAAAKKVTLYRRRQEQLSNSFSEDGELRHCNDIPQLISMFDENYDPNDCRLNPFIKEKHQGRADAQYANIPPSFPIAYSRTIKKFTTTFKLCWKRSITLNTNGFYAPT